MTRAAVARDAGCADELAGMRASGERSSLARLARHGRHPQSLDRWTLYNRRRGEICGKYFEAGSGVVPSARMIGLPVVFPGFSWRT